MHIINIELHPLPQTKKKKKKSWNLQITLLANRKHCHEKNMRSLKTKVTFSQVHYS